jgi:hypothetical protein
MAPDKRRRGDDDLIDWFTVSYKTIYTIVGGLLAVGGLIGYYYYNRSRPDPTPPPTTTAPTVPNSAKFLTLEGSVQVKPKAEFDWKTADRTLLLRKGDLVKTGPGSHAEIEFFDGTRVSVRPGSLIIIEQSAEGAPTQQSKVAWHISSGVVDLNTSDTNTVDVSTPTITSTVGERSNASIRVAETGETNMNVYQGSAVVDSKQGQRTELKSNEGLTVDPGGKAKPKVGLPGTPTLQAPPHAAEISYPNPLQATTLFAWSPVPGATSYHVMLDYNPFFTKPLVDRKGIKETTVQLRGLDVGKYYWCVAAVDKEEVEGRFSEFFRFTVSRPSGVASGGPPPPLLVEALDVRDNIAQVRGRTEPGATVTVNGHALNVRTDGSFDDLVVLTKAGQQWIVIRAIGVSGGVKEERRPITAAF